MEDEPSFVRREQIRQTLIRDIQAAFRDVRREDGITLHEAEALDQCVSDKRRLQARKRDTDTRWQDVPDEQIKNHYSIFCFLDAKGFRYYLPAYMIWSLKYYAVCDSASSDFTIYACAPNGKGKPSKVQQECFEAMDITQKQAICRFLRYMVNESDGHADADAAQNALNAYWGQFCAPSDGNPPIDLKRNAPSS